MQRRLHHHFVRAHRAHLVVHSFGQARGFAFNVVERFRVRQHAHLPCAFCRPIQDGRQLLNPRRLQRTFGRHLAKCFSLPQDDPALCDWVFAKFHAVSSARVTRRCGPLLQAVTVPDRAFAGVIRHFEILC